MSNAPRITPDQIDDAIANARQVQYHHFPDTNHTVCCVTLENGFTIVGDSCSVSAENFDAGIGQSIAMDAAKDKLWELMGFELKGFIYRNAHNKAAQ